MADVERLGIVSWLVLTAVAIVPVVFGTGFTQFEFLKESLLAVLAGAALAGWGVAVIRGRTISITAGRIATLLGAFSVFALVAIAWAPAWTSGAVSSANWIAAGALFLCVVAPIGRPIDFKAFALATSVGIILASGVGLLDLAGLGLTTTVWDPPGAAGPFDAREFAVGYYAAALPIAAGAIFRLDALPRITASVALVTGAVHFGLVADPTFVGIVAGVAVAVVIVMGALQGFDRISLTFGPLGALVIAAGIAAVLGFAGPRAGSATDAVRLPWVGQVIPDGSVETAEIRDPRFAIGRIEEARNWEARSYVTGIAFDLFRDEPIVGHGPGGWWAMQTKYPRPNESFVSAMYERYPAFRSPHNGLSLVMVELGGVGLLLLLLWLSALLGITITAVARKAELENWLIEHFALVTAVSGGFVLTVFTPALQLASSVCLLFVAAGLLARESAALNDYKGLSEVWSINAEGRRWDTTFFCGVIPAVVGVGLIALGGFWVTTTYYRSWGDLLMLRTKHELALEQYEVAAGLDPHDGETLYNRALALRRLGRLGEAVDELNRAALLRPYDVRIINLLSSIHLREREYADAVKAARRAVELFPNYIEGRRSLAAALDLQGRLNEAANELLAILELDPGDRVRGQLHHELGAYYEGPLDNPKKAIEHYEKAIPLIDKAQAKDLEPRVEELKKKLERERLRREGKPIPQDLMPEPEAPDPHDGHGH